MLLLSPMHLLILPTSDAQHLRHKCRWNKDDSLWVILLIRYSNSEIGDPYFSPRRSYITMEGDLKPLRNWYLKFPLDYLQSLVQSSGHYLFFWYRIMKLTKRIWFWRRGQSLSLVSHFFFTKHYIELYGTIHNKKSIIMPMSDPDQLVKTIRLSKQRSFYLFWNSFFPC